jgi:hypothetical protein
MRSIPRSAVRLVLLLAAGACATSYSGREDADAHRPDGGDGDTSVDVPDAETSDGTPDGPPACPPGRTRCGTDCVDVTSNPVHCGGCDLACPEGLVCNEGGCASGCSGLLTLCGAACVDTATSAEHCGSCDRRCPDGLNADGVCSARTCGLVCRAGWLDLDGAPGCEYRCTPTGADICNGRDDDCDGTTDEGSAETCNGRDDDCDGSTDEGFFCVAGATESCSTSCGSLGSRTCTAGCAWGSCAAPAESCNGRDDDCDGTCDDGFACCAGATQGCATSCGTTGTQTCSASCGWDACSPPAETCNATDDDCDGTCDEGCRHPIHRAYSSAATDHLYTTDLAEATCCGYSLEVENYFYLYNDRVAGTTELWRCWLGASGDHFYTTSSTCEGAPGAVLEGNSGFIGSSAFCGGFPLYRVSGPSDHFYTTSAAERDSAVAGGWIDEGIAGYVWSE